MAWQWVVIRAFWKGEVGRVQWARVYSAIDRINTDLAEVAEATLLAVRIDASDILGHKKVNLAMDVYDRTDVEDFVQPLALVFNELLPSCYPGQAAAMSQR
jgi:hypothetical protein